jgi:Uma2 family endonuclease
MPGDTPKVGAAARVTRPAQSNDRRMARKRRVTFDEFCEIIREDQKADLIDGVIYMASPENTEANDLFVWLITLLNLYVQEKELGTVFGQRVALRLNDRNGPEPDILVMKSEHEDRILRGHILGPADLAIEIVTPDSIRRDYEDKRGLYEQHGIAEYWIIDEEQQTVTALRLNTRGKYREIKPVKGVMNSTSLPGFWLRLEWLWESPRPKVMAIVRQLLGS